MASLNGKVVIVTGASHGIGRAIAERLAKEGAAVVVNYGGRCRAGVSPVEATDRLVAKTRLCQLCSLLSLREVRRLLCEPMSATLMMSDNCLSRRCKDSGG